MPRDLLVATLKRALPSLPSLCSLLFVLSCSTTTADAAAAAFRGPNDLGWVRAELSLASKSTSAGYLRMCGQRSTCTRQLAGVPRLTAVVSLENAPAVLACFKFLAPDGTRQLRAAPSLRESPTKRLASPATRSSSSPSVLDHRPKGFDLCYAPRARFVPGILAVRSSSARSTGSEGIIWAASRGTQSQKL